MTSNENRNTCVGLRLLLFFVIFNSYSSKAIFQISQRHHQVGLFVQQGVGVKPIYSRAVKEFYRSEIKTVDFGASGSGNVVKAVNEWVEEATEGKLLEILDKVGTCLQCF